MYAVGNGIVPSNTVDYYCIGKPNRIFVLQMTSSNKSHVSVTLVQLLLATMGHLHYCSVFAVEISTKPMTSLDPRHLPNTREKPRHTLLAPLFLVAVNSPNAQLPQTRPPLSFYSLCALFRVRPLTLLLPTFLFFPLKRNTPQIIREVGLSNVIDRGICLLKKEVFSAADKTLQSSRKYP